MSRLEGLGGGDDGKKGGGDGKKSFKAPAPVAKGRRSKSKDGKASAVARKVEPGMIKNTLITASDQVKASWERKRAESRAADDTAKQRELQALRGAASGARASAMVGRFAGPTGPAAGGGARGVGGGSGGTAGPSGAVFTANVGEGLKSEPMDAADAEPLISWDDIEPLRPDQLDEMPGFLPRKNATATAAWKDFDPSEISGAPTGDEPTHVANKNGLRGTIEEGQTSSEYFLMQLPTHLPIRALPPAGEKAGPSTPAVMTLAEAPEGHIGSLNFHKSGKVTFQMGSVRYEVLQGTDLQYHQQLAIVHAAPLPSINDPTKKEDAAKGGKGGGKGGGGGAAAMDEDEQKPDIEAMARNKISLLGGLQTRLVCTLDTDTF